jgi:hypothetical protein
MIYVIIMKLFCLLWNMVIIESTRNSFPHCNYYLQRILQEGSLEQIFPPKYVCLCKSLFVTLCSSYDISQNIKDIHPEVI